MQEGQLREPENERKSYTLSQVAGGIKKIIEERTKDVWITAEVVKLNYYPLTGYAIPELAEKHGDKLIAQMRATVWKDVFELISRKLRNEAGEALTDGMKIMFLASVTFHPVYGIGLNIKDVDPTFTLGEMARRRLEAIRKLKEEGIFDHNKQIQLPILPRRIAVISVESSKGFSDFVRILRENPQHYMFEVTLFPAIMQGDRAVSTIMAQMQDVFSRKNQFDVLAIIRGGGDDTGLTCYDDYHLARAISLAPLPVISGIGHSTNLTVAEQVSAVHKITPTDAAYFLVERYQIQEERIDAVMSNIREQTMRLVMVNRNFIRHFSRDLAISSNRKLALASQKLARSEQFTHALTMRRLAKEDGRFRQWGELAVRATRMKFRKSAEFLDQSTRVAAPFASRIMVRQHETLDRLVEKMSLLNPDNLLKRGYAIVSVEDKAITDSSRLQKGNMVRIRFAKGEASAEIIDTFEGNE